MSLRELYEYALVETNKLGAPSLLLEDYNYFINKAVQQYVNLIYSRFETDQQSTDDLRVLKTSVALEPIRLNQDIYKGVWSCSYIVVLPEDYHHLIGCTIEYDINKQFKCYNAGQTVMFPVRRLSTDMYSQIVNNAYMSPSYKRPYYFISNIGGNAYQINTESNNVNLPQTEEANIVAKFIAKKIYDDVNSDSSTVFNQGDSEVAKTVKSDAIKSIVSFYLNNDVVENSISTDISSVISSNVSEIDIIDKIIKNDDFATLYNYKGDKQLYNANEDKESRLSNPSAVILELRFGKDDSLFTPINVYVDYLRSPKYLRLTQEEIEQTEDVSQILEFPDYVCFEIANIFTRLLLENASDPRLQTNIPINNTITSAAQQQAAAQK